LQVVPPPNVYNLPTFIETNSLHAKGFTPRFSREVQGQPHRKSLL
jgi:hypothetical protein